MPSGDVAVVLHQMLIVAVTVNAPPLLAGLCIGLVVSLLQAVTQINEATLAFVPKVIAIGATLALLGSFMMGTLRDFTLHIFDRLVAAGGS
jgi:flagellar biosynthesis protein FliQ